MLFSVRRDGNLQLNFAIFRLRFYSLTHQSTIPLFSYTTPKYTLFYESVYSQGWPFVFLSRISIHMAVENNYDNYIDRAHAFILSFCYALKKT